MAWLERFSPTPGRSVRTSMPSSRNPPAAPMPERIRNAGECTPPAERMTSRPRSSLTAPSMRAVTPVTRRPSNNKPVAVARLMMLKLLRARTAVSR